MKKEILNLWSTDTIRDMLQNEMYLGHMIQGKTTKLNYKSKRIISLSKEDWIKVENTHEPIVSKQTFDTVQLLLKSNKNKTKKTYDYLLKGMIKCAECNHTIGIQHYNDRKNNYTICNYYRKYGKKRDVCTAHRFQYEELERMVLDKIKEDCLNHVDTTSLANLLKEKFMMRDAQNNVNKKIEQWNREIVNLQKQIDIIYEDRLNQVIDEKQYQRMIQKKQDAIIYIQSNIDMYKKNIEKNHEKNIPYYEEKIKKFISLDNPDKIMIVKWIDVIYLSEDGTINIYYRVKNSSEK